MNKLLLFFLISINIFAQASYQREWSRIDYGGRIFHIDSKNENLYYNYDVLRNNDPKLPMFFGEIYKFNAISQTEILHYEFPHPSQSGNGPYIDYVVRLENFLTDNSGNFIYYGRTHNTTHGTPGVYSQTPLTTPFTTPYTGFSFIAKVSPTGTILWFTFFHDLIQNAFTLAVDKNNNIYVGSYRNRDDVLSSNTFQPTGDKNSGNIYQQVISKLNANGQHVWSTFYQNGDSNIRNIVAGDTGIYIYGDHLGAYNSNYFGTKNSFQEFSSSLNSNGSASTAFLSKFDFNGNRLWSTYIGDQISKAPTSYAHIPYTITVINDEPYVLTELHNENSNARNFSTSNAYLENQTSFLKNTLLSKFASNGQRIWSTYLHCGHSIFATTNNDLLITGEVEQSYPYIINMATSSDFQSTHEGKLDIYTSIISNDGSSLLHGTFYGKNGDDTGMALPSKNGYFLVGTTKNNPQAYNYFDTTGKLLSTKNNTFGYSGIFVSYFKLINLSNHKNTLNIKTNIFPNPASDVLNITSDQTLDDNTELTVYDINGRKILNKKINNGNNFHTININHLNPGVYILKISSDNFEQSHKFIKN